MKNESKIVNGEMEKSRITNQWNENIGRKIVTTGGKWKSTKI